MQDYFDAEQMARQYVPERLEILEQMPRTATGKIQKFQLREQAQSLQPDSSLTG